MKYDQISFLSPRHYLFLPLYFFVFSVEETAQGQRSKKKTKRPLIALFTSLIPPSASLPGLQASLPSQLRVSSYFSRRSELLCPPKMLLRLMAACGHDADANDVDYHSLLSDSSYFQRTRVT